jgi:sec-independent protein translocase protein TatB
MFEIGSSEILVILILALLVLGPQNLPKVARTIGKVTSQIRRLTNEFRDAVDDEVRALELKELKAEETKKKATTPAQKKEPASGAPAATPALARPDIQKIGAIDTPHPAERKSTRVADPYGLGKNGEPDPDWDTLKPAEVAPPGDDGGEPK